MRGKSLPEMEVIARQRPGDPIARYYLGKAYYLNRRFSEARQNYDAAVRLDPTWSRAHLGLGLSLCELGQLDEARGEFLLAKRWDKDSAWADYMLGKLAWQAGHVDEAATYVSRAAQLDPRSDQAWFGVASCHTRLRQYDKAIDALREAVARNETNPRYHTSLGELLMHVGKPDEAVRHYERAIALAPDHGQAFALLGRYYLQQGTGADAADRALRLLERASSLSTVRPDEVLLDLGQAYFRRGRFAEAVTALQKSIRLQPADERAYFVLANALRRLGRTSQADAAEQRFRHISALHVRLQGLEAVTHHDPSDAAKQLELARLYRDLGLMDKAAARYLEVLNLTPDAQAPARELQMLDRHSVTGKLKATVPDSRDFAVTIPPQ